MESKPKSKIANGEISFFFYPYECYFLLRQFLGGSALVINFKNLDASFSVSNSFTRAPLGISLFSCVRDFCQIPNLFWNTHHSPIFLFMELFMFLR